MFRSNAVVGGAVLAATTFLSFGLAQAGVIPANLEVDFRSRAWASANWRNSYTVGDVTATASPTTKLLWQDSTDGLGVRGGTQSDEIELEEILEVKFANGGKAVSGVWITDLFDAPDGAIGEKGLVVINGTMVFRFDGNLADQINGELFVSFGGNIVVESAVFYADNKYPGVNPKDNEFSVAGFAGVVPGPIVATEPGTFGLLALSCAGLMALGLRRRRA